MSETFKRQVGEKTLLVRCRPDLEAQARSFLNIVAQHEHVGRGLNDGVKLQIGGALFALRTDMREIIVTQPDYSADDPLQIWIEDLTSSLLVLAAQAGLIAKLGVRPEECAWIQTMTLVKGALQERKVYLQRSRPSSPQDSGWHLGPAGKSESASNDPSAYACMRVCDLFRSRPPLLRVVSLPYEYIAIFDGNELIGIANENNQEIYRTE